MLREPREGYNWETVSSHRAQIGELFTKKKKKKKKNTRYLARTILKGDTNVKLHQCKVACILTSRTTCHALHLSAPLNVKMRALLPYFSRGKALALRLSKMESTEHTNVIKLYVAFPARMAAEDRRAWRLFIPATLFPNVPHSDYFLFPLSNFFLPFLCSSTSSLHGASSFFPHGRVISPEVLLGVFPALLGIFASPHRFFFFFFPSSIIHFCAPRKTTKKNRNCPFDARATQKIYTYAYAITILISLFSQKELYITCS
ncbi:hypothetical protein POVWA1_015230 [Plasmodium ovale wallikeri]|uniref:Uncharacterized protein n=1 Tax=Plasmodium ovale wallikeri TaxID=864142 RepID=A0A1A8YNS1_PLAOA|nr:hypothetical protein POVWA1_015230 [Plasmodium ovale wallikeri]